jgi:DNA invertase Pin-like site-specific DNA recombinase
MTVATAMRNRNRTITFEDLRGLRAECYVRDSTLDQKDGFGPDMQRRAMDNFARCYDLVLGTACYTDFITGTSTLKRSGFHQALTDARADGFDVLLVYHTSRFARNRSDAIRYKAELARLGKTVVFVSQGIISGNDRDFLNEGINEILDEQYSRNLSQFVSEGLRAKHEQGIANGIPPLGYRSEKLENGKRERKVPDTTGIGGNPQLGGIAALLALLQGYATGSFSYHALADQLNSEGYRNREGEPFTKGSVEHVLSNRFYEGKAVLHPDEPDEEVIDGTHELPIEVKSLWLRCQDVKRRRAIPSFSSGRPRLPKRSYPFSRVAVCDLCGRHYGGQPNIRKSGKLVRRLWHSRPYCELVPHSTVVENLSNQFSEKVLPYMRIDRELKSLVHGELSQMPGAKSGSDETTRLERAMANLKKQHLWGDITDEEYKHEKRQLDQRLAQKAIRSTKDESVDFARMELLLSEFESLWSHPGVSDEQRERLISEVFLQVRLRGGILVAIQPRPEYQPIFLSELKEGVRNGRGEWI